MSTIEGYTVETEMPFGRYKGKKLGEIPAWYLVWLSQQEEFKNSNRKSDIQLRHYVEDNITKLKK